MLSPLAITAKKRAPTHSPKSRMSPFLHIGGPCKAQTLAIIQDTGAGAAEAAGGRGEFPATLLARERNNLASRHLLIHLFKPDPRPSDVFLIENRKNCLAQLLELAVLPHRLFQIRPQFDSLLDGFRRSLEISVRAVYPGQVEISPCVLGFHLHRPAERLNRFFQALRFEQ